MISQPYGTKCLQKWRQRGVRVIAWTVNNSLQKLYLNNYLGVSSMSDTMDQIPESVLLSSSANSSESKKLELNEGGNLEEETSS